MLAKTLGVHQLVVAINKMDDKTVNWGKERYDEIVGKLAPFFKQSGFRPKGAPPPLALFFYIYCSWKEIPTPYLYRYHVSACFRYWRRKRQEPDPRGSLSLVQVSELVVMSLIESLGGRGGGYVPLFSFANSLSFSAQRSNPSAAFG